MENLFVLRIVSGFSPYPFISTCFQMRYHCMIVLPAHKLQYVKRKCAALSMLSHVASGVKLRKGMEV